MKNKRIVLIPSAKLVPIELQIDFGKIPSAMIPIEGKPLLSYIIDQYNNADFVIAVNEKSEDLIEYCNKHLCDKKIKIIDVGKTKSLGETIFYALSNYKQLKSQLIINFADTYIKTNNIWGNNVYFSKQKDSYRWTTFELNTFNKLHKIDDKETEKENNDCLQNIFIGIFSFLKINNFLLHLDKSLKSKSDIEPFYDALINYNLENTISFNECNEWFDFGHIDTYYKSRYQLVNLCRNFNTIHVNNFKGIITKKSQNFEKFKNEISWYLNLPKNLKYISPRVFDYNLEKQNSFLKMELYGYPVLNDLYLYGNLDLGTWAIIFNAIELTLETFSKVVPVDKKIKKLKKSMHYMYEEKTFQRMQIYKDLEQFSWAKNKNLKINELSVLSIQEIYESIPFIIKKSKIYENTELCIIHGDFCFSNILFDRKNTSVRLIDPRGSFGEYSIIECSGYALPKRRT